MKVAMIPDNTRLILNEGKLNNDALYLGAKLEIYSPIQDIVDPDSKKVIGEYGIAKDVVEITKLYDYYSEARKIRRTSYSPIGGAVSPLLTNRTNSSIEKLNVNKKHELGIRNEATDIDVGDKVRIIFS